MRWTAVGLLGLMALAVAAPVAAAGPAWQRVATVPGIFDIGGPRRDGWLVVAGAAKLYLVDPAGAVTPYAQGPGGYADDKGAEAYLAVSPAQHPGGPGCYFQPDYVYILRLHAPLGITQVDPQGIASNFATIPGVLGLGGIAFDVTGGFGHRLLVEGAVPGGKTEVAAVDCSGSVQVLTRTGLVMEGGFAVAPADFGAFGGDLIGPDELSGNIYAIGADGTSTLIVKSGLPSGGDIGVEGVGFVPPGFMAGGRVFYADRRTPGNRHPGTDSLLELTNSDLAAAGVRDGDLLSVTEGGMSAIAVRCAATCTVIPVVAIPTTAHGEGHLVFKVDQASQASPSPSPSPTPPVTPAPKSSPQKGSPAVFVAIILVVVVLGAGVLMTVRNRWR